ncbi:MAG TPA: VWA domain-containing protein [Blastocatellia bacterium]|nr:VWA domain-containing protein [Blastocatellia bacterium]
MSRFKKVTRIRLVVIVSVLALVVLPAGAQQQRTQKPVPQDDEPIKLNTTLVQVPVVVSERGGRYVSNMTRGEFSIFEDGTKQEIELFGSIEEPFSVALLLDSSGSTQATLEQIKAAAMSFLGNLRPHDRVMVVSFNDSVEVLSELTNDTAKLGAAVQSIKSGEYTQVYEAVYTAVWEKLRDVPGRKAVIVFSDGIDTASSEISLEDTLDAVIESEDIIVYPIRYATREDVERKIEARLKGSLVSNEDAAAQAKMEQSRRELDRAYRGADEYFQQLADMSGGVVERADKPGDLKAALGRIAEELRHQYLLGYYPTNKQKDDKSRRITVRVTRQGAIVRARPAYRLAQ